MRSSEYFLGKLSDLSALVPPCFFRKVGWLRSARSRRTLRLPKLHSNPEANPLSSPPPIPRRVLPLSPASSILVMPRLLNLVIAIYLIIVGLMGLNAIYYWVQ
jgi:DUF3096 family protein